MGSSSGRKPSDLDTSQPGVRQIQTWIRSRTTVMAQLHDSTQITGAPRWVDTEFLAMQQEPGDELVLINRSAIAMIRALL